MAEPRLVHSDRWADIIDRPEDDCVEIRWFDTTTHMEAEEFNEFLAAYAGHVEACGRSGGLIDGLQFRMDFAKMDAGWRDRHIIPRYNAAGLKKFAFIMPAGMPAIGAPPAPEGPAEFTTGYFATRAEALAWFKS